MLNKCVYSGCNGERGYPAPASRPGVRLWCKYHHQKYWKVICKYSEEIPKFHDWDFVNNGPPEILYVVSTYKSFIVISNGCWDGSMERLDTFEGEKYLYVYDRIRIENIEVWKLRRSLDDIARVLRYIHEVG